MKLGRGNREVRKFLWVHDTKAILGAIPDTYAVDHVHDFFDFEHVDPEWRTMDVLVLKRLRK